mmetsp:Transcript_31226/g.51554  ORF Transcript_31226/g.51554 Transcript_31226/m.51554 type:complete len:485 (+) Transcript_31226:132-1586(+)|eukprot:CAMPEP_0119023154 /NCGR_PEP_ID=MMETSP1176-20130426/29435_1 /TAXON_ID=265551 /ORGANISM="Synedropsis recta cf, Strain CCMP1620" /LENGTH=484 /DNA_ID=CAMNT_0006978163 /DNA_START=124 /DNA_END=1578 /DNA_ORIENTATION=-
MVRITAEIGDFFSRRRQDLRNISFRRGRWWGWGNNNNNDDDDGSTVATIDDIDGPTTSHGRSMAAIAALREDNDKTHPMTVVLWKVSILLIGFPLITYYTAKWAGLLPTSNDDINDGNDGAQQVHNTGAWTQISSQIFNRVSSMAMSRDGSIVSIGDALEGCVQIFEARPSWQILDEICDSSSDLFGSVVSLSGDGAVLAVSGMLIGAQDGAEQQRPGFVRTYERVRNSSQWLPMGQDMVGASHDEFFGASIDLSDSGAILAVGAPGNSTPLLLEGRVYIYNFNSTHWHLTGESLRSLDNPNRFGNSVSLSASGNVVAIGVPSSMTNGSIEVHRFYADAWTRVSEPLQGQFPNETFGQSVSVVAVGDAIIIAGSSRSLDNTTGRVQVFESINGGAWAQIKYDIFHSDAGTIEVDLSDDGAFLAIGAHQSSYLFSIKGSELWKSLVPFWMSGGQKVAVSATDELRVATSRTSANGDSVVIYEGFS